MSHNYMVRCKCGQETERWNHAEDNLLQAVKDSYPLYLLSKTSWEVHYEQECKGFYNGLAQFLARHWDHGGFEVVGEYSSDIPKPVRPDAPPHVYEQVCTERLRKELDDLLGRARALRNGLNPEEEEDIPFK